MTIRLRDPLKTYFTRPRRAFARWRRRRSSRWSTSPVAPQTRVLLPEGDTGPGGAPALAPAPNAVPASR
jgi:hypothetical protein